MYLLERHSSCAYSAVESEWMLWRGGDLAQGDVGLHIIDLQVKPVWTCSLLVEVSLVVGSLENVDDWGWFEECFWVHVCPLRPWVFPSFSLLSSLIFVRLVQFVCGILVASFGGR